MRRSLRVRRGGGWVFGWPSLAGDSGPRLGFGIRAYLKDGPNSEIKDQSSVLAFRVRSSFRGVSPSAISEIRSQPGRALLPHPFRSPGSHNFKALDEGPVARSPRSGQTHVAHPPVLAHLALGTHQSWRWSWRCWRRGRYQGVRARWRHCCLPGPCWWPHQPCGGRSRAAEPPVG